MFFASAETRLAFRFPSSASICVICGPCCYSAPILPVLLTVIGKASTPTVLPGWARAASYSTNSISLGRQVLSSQGSSGPYMRRMMNQLLPGMV